jgi:hypothetical protein
MLMFTTINIMIHTTSIRQIVILISNNYKIHLFLNKAKISNFLIKIEKG